MGSLLIKISRNLNQDTKDMKTEKVKSKNSKLPILGGMASCSWKCVVVAVGVLILLGAFKISGATGFALVIGLCVGSLGEKFGQWDNNQL